MAHDGFLKLPDVRGKAVQGETKDWIGIHGYSFKIESASEADGTEKVVRKATKLGDLAITKDVDLASPLLLAFCGSNHLFPEAMIRLYASDGNARQLYMSLKFQNARIVKIEFDLDDAPTETLTLSVESVEMETWRGKNSQGMRLLVDPASAL